MQPITQNKKRIKVQHIIGGGSTQVDINRNIQLPATIRKIVDIHTEIVELDYEIIPNKVIIKGALHKQIYYVEEGDYVVKEFTVMREEFTDFVHVQGARPEMEALLDGHVLFVNTSPASGDFPTSMLYQAAVLAVDVRVIECLTLDVVTDCYGEGLSVQRAPFSVECLVGDGCKQATISAEHLLNKPARKIFDMQAVCRNVDYEILPGRVIVRGSIHKQIFYVDAEDDTVQAQDIDHEFSVVVDVPGATPDMEAYIRCRLELCEAKLVGSSNNLVKASCILQVSVKVTQLTRMNIVTAVEGAQVDRCRIRVEDIVGKKCHQENVNQTIDVNSPEDVNGILVKQAKNLTANIRDVSYEKVLNKVIIKGVIHVQAYYIACTPDQELRETSSDIPFTTVVHFDCIDENTMIRVRERVEYTDAKVDGVPCETSNIRAVAILDICVCAYQTREFFVVTNVCHSNCDCQQPCAPICGNPKPCNDFPYCNDPHTHGYDYTCDYQQMPIVKPTPYPCPCADGDTTSGNGNINNNENNNSNDNNANQEDAEICPTGGYRHVVRQGDTLAKIATMYQSRVPGLTWQILARYNGIVAPYTLAIGQIVRIPCVTGKG